MPAQGVAQVMKSKLEFLAALVVVTALAAAAQQPLTIRNKQLTVEVRAQDGAYEILSAGLEQPVLISNVGVEMNDAWLRSSDYPHHEATEASFEDALGQGRALRITFSGLAGKPDLVCTVHLYDDEPYGDISVLVRTGRAKAFLCKPFGLWTQ